MVSPEELLINIETSLKQQNPSDFSAALTFLIEYYQSKKRGENPWEHGSKAISEINIQKDKRPISLLDYVLRWQAPLNDDQKDICKNLFDALGKHLLNEEIGKDPLVLACQDSKNDIVTLLIPHYTRRQDDLTHEGNKRTDEELEAMSARLMAAIDITTSEETLNLIAGNNDDTSAAGAVSPSFGKHPLTQNNNDGTHGDAIQEKIASQRKKITSAKHSLQQLTPASTPAPTPTPATAAATPTRTPAPPETTAATPTRTPAPPATPETTAATTETKSPTYWKEGMALGFTFGCLAIGCLIGTACLVEHCTEKYSDNTFDASKMFKDLATFIWESIFKHNHTPVSNVLLITGAGFTAATAGVGAAIGSQKSLNANPK